MVRGGPYNVGSAQGTITFQGTAENPAFVVGVGNPVVQGAYGARLTLAGSYGVWEGVVFDNVAIALAGNLLNLRRCEVRDHESAGSSAAIATVGDGIILRENHIHHNGNSENPKEVDVHGILVVPGSQGVWIVGNDIHHNGGDSIQVGQAQSTEPWAQYVFITANNLHEDRENGVDVKKARDVVIVQNVIYGYKERNSSSGEGVVTHDGAERIWVLNNFIAATVRGVVCTGAKVYVVMGNIFRSIRHNPANTYDPASLYASHAIITTNSQNVFHLQNTIVESDGGISLPAGNSGSRVVNNNISLSDVQRIAGTTSEALDNWVSGDPGFAGENDYRLAQDSPCLGAGTPHQLAAFYQFLYGEELATIYGESLPNPPNIGAA